MTKPGRDIAAAPGISDSRFYMWRAVFAMAHADGKIAPEETKFVENYLEHVPFSAEQRSIIQEDLAEPQETGDMLSRVTEPEDQGQFFDFSRLLVWCDGEYDHWEESAVQRHLEGQMKKFNLDRMSEDLRLYREEARIRNDREALNDAVKARESVGLAALLKGVLG